MSVLETPRIYFRGQVAWDPIVTNNYENFYDESDAEPVYPSVPQKVEAFRKQAICAVAPPIQNWNPQGTHRSQLFDCAISGVDRGHGLDTKDPFVGSPANFLGMLVDLEPYGTFSSQLFFDTLSFGVDGGYRIAAPRNTRMTARYINFTRNPVGYKAGVASVVWQTCFAKDAGLLIDPHDSKALRDLLKAVDADDVRGLTVQWNAYRTIYYDCPEIATDKQKLAEVSAELIAKLNDGGFQPNPARSMVVGTIGLWRPGEPVHEPCDRTLVGPTGNPAATAHARLKGNVLTLDLSNSISEKGLDLVKQDLKTLSIVAVDGKGGKPVPLARFGYADYDRKAYDASSGIVTLKADPDGVTAAKAGLLQMLGSDGKPLLTEYALRAIPVEPNLYMDEGESATAQIQVYDRGAPAGAGVAVTICVMSADGNSVESSFATSTGAGGIAEFPLSGTGGSIAAYVPLPGPDPVQPDQGIDPQVNTYMYVRTLPADADIAALDPTWTNVYENVLANWNAMAPCMDNWLRLGDEAQVRAYGPLLRKLTDPGALEIYRYMPVTRDMTAGERTLLYNFLGTPPKTVAARGLAAAAPATTPAKPPLGKLASLNRSMR
jgi:hypothetical protein